MDAAAAFRSSSGLRLCTFQVCSLKSPDFLCSSGPEASRLRSALNPKMLKLQEVATFAPMVNVVVGDLLRRVEFLRKGSQDGVTVSDIASELYKFGFEGSSCFSVSSKFFFFFLNPEFFGNCKFLQESQRSCLKPGWDAWRKRWIQMFSASSQPSTTCCPCQTWLTLSLGGPAASSPYGGASSRPGTTSQTLVSSRKGPI